MKLKLVRAAEEYRPQITEMLEEWFASGEKIVPYAIRRLDYHDFADYCRNLDITDTNSGLVPDSTYFCLDEERNRMVGAVNIRHYLNDALLRNGGHIGDGVRPSERRKGIATEMIGLALQKCRELGIRKVLMVCDKENIGSAKSIIRNGGILENEILEDGVIEQRYWITLEAQESCAGSTGKLRNMASVYLRQNGRVLLLYRQGSRVVNDVWIGSAGGHFEAGELNDARACVLRELEEELSVTEDMLRNLELRYITLRRTKGEIRQNYYFFADLKEEPQKKLTSTEGTLEWFSADQLPELEMPFSARYVMDHYLELGRHNHRLYGGIADGERVIFTELPEF